jgi:hypothetical protein
VPVSNNRTIPPIYYGTNQFDRYNQTKNRYEKVLRVGSALEEFVWEAIPACNIGYRFHGVDYNSARNELISDDPLYTTKVGAAGTITAVNALYGGMDMATGGVANNNILVQTGDVSGAAATYTYNVAQDIYFTANFRMPNAADITNVSIIAGLYADANNYVAIRLNTAVDGNIYFVTRAAAAETTTSLGAAASNTWYRVYVRAQTGTAWIISNGSATTTHVANIPAGNLSLYGYVETLNAVVKHFQFR